MYLCVCVQKVFGYAQIYLFAMWPCVSVAASPWWSPQRSTDLCTSTSSCGCSTSSCSSSSSCRAAGNGVPAMAQPQQPPQQQVAGAGAIQFSIAQLLQRPTRLFQEHNVVPCSVPSASTCNTANTYQLHETQSAYEEYCELVRSAYSDEFWRVFATVYRERAVIIDRVLKTCKKVFVPGKSRKNLFAVRI